MKRSLAILAIVCASLVRAQQSQSLPVEWGNGGSLVPGNSIELLSHLRDGVLEVAATPAAGAKPDAPAVGLAHFPVAAVAPDSAGIAFDFKGDGSTHFASVFLGESTSLLNAYEAMFSLESTEWRTITLRWRDFVRNDLPWDAHARLGAEDIAFAPGKLKFIGFGRGNGNYKFYTPRFSFAIRNLRVVSRWPDPPMPAFSKGLTRTQSLLQQKKPLSILLLGDSITDLGGSRSYGYHCAQLIKQKWGVDCTVANAGISGHTARFGTLVLPRSLLAVPNPDLVCILDGADDCKAVDGKTGFSQTVFARNLETLVDEVRRRTEGRADLVLLSGVPRLDKRGGRTTGAIETIVGAVQGVARGKQTAFCDTFPAYLALPPAQRNTYYQDTIHQSQAGLQFLGSLVFKTIEAP